MLIANTRVLLPIVACPQVSNFLLASAYLEKLISCINELNALIVTRLLTVCAPWGSMRGNNKVWITVRKGYNIHLLATMQTTRSPRRMGRNLHPPNDASPWSLTPRYLFNLGTTDGTRHLTTSVSIVRDEAWCMLTTWACTTMDNGCMRSWWQISDCGKDGWRKRSNLRHTHQITRL